MSNANANKTPDKAADKPTARAAPIPLTVPEQQRQIAVINRRYQTGELTALEAQAEIDAVNALPLSEP